MKGGQRVFPGASLPRKLELPFSSALAPERRQDPPVDVEDLYPVIVRVGHNDPVRARDGDVMRVLQLPGLVAHRAEFPYKRSIRLENLQQEKHTVATFTNRIC